MSRAQPRQTTQVWDRGRFLGTVCESDDRRGWLAVDRDGEVYGVFQTRQQAGRAITDEHDRRSAERLRRMRSQ